VVIHSRKPNSTPKCEQCGAALTNEELQAAIERGEPMLCAIHAAELEPALELQDAEPDEPSVNSE